MVSGSLLIACTCSRPDPSTLAQGTWRLTGQGASGWLEVEEGCRVALFGESWDTGPDGLQACTDLGDGWVRLPFRSGSGEGTITGRFDGQKLLVPLGARGEFDLSLEATTGSIDEVSLAETAAASEAIVAADREAWEEGWFRIQVEGMLVGELEMASDREMWLQLYDPSWMTEDRVQARIYEDGAELVLHFPVMPALGDAGGVIRLNRPLKLLVVPVATNPDPHDRVLALVAGRVSEEERTAARAWALEEGGRKERETMLPLLATLAEKCAMDEEWELLLRGYDVGFVRDEEGCLVRVDPAPVQHGRRLSAEVRSSGPVNVLLRPL